MAGSPKVAAGLEEMGQMARVRMLFSKRGPFCFIRHVDLPQIFSRSARRADLEIEQTEGFSPHPKISLGPALPVGVVACAEPGEIWFSRWEEGYLSRFNSFLPDGLAISAAEEVDGKALNKLCEAAEYVLRPQDPSKMDLIAMSLDSEGLLEGSVYRWSVDSGLLNLVMGDPSQNGPGKIVKALSEKGVIGGWTDVRMARLSVGLWDEASRSVKPLVSLTSGPK
ncbi:MAG: DUF2344 domain-containing protein [Synergistales bacterium]|nr:DUF2344 domain-containing protein [Synergistales bacterium]